MPLSDLLRSIPGLKSYAKGSLLLEVEITGAKFGIGAGRFVQSDLDELLEDRNRVAERLAVIEDDANSRRRYLVVVQ